MAKKTYKLFALVVILSLMVPFSASGSSPLAPPVPVTFTILHTNDFHGQLQAADPDPGKISTPGMARLARVINGIRTAKGADNVLLVDAGDEMQGSLLSNLGDGTPTGKGIPTIATFNAMHYDVATFGNHEFDWGLLNLFARLTQATYPFVTANIVAAPPSGTCSAAGWDIPAGIPVQPFIIKTVGVAPNQVKVAFIGVTTMETPIITVASATAGLCFKDPTLSIEHYYSQMIAAGADVLVVLSHLGYTDGGYGYGIPVYGDQTLAKNLINDGNPVNLIIGGHSHTSVSAPGTTVTVSGKTGSTLVVQAAYNGRRVGEADITVGTDGSVSINWTVTVWTQKNTTAVPPIPDSVWRTYTSSTAFTEDHDVSEDPGIASVINTYATDENYLNLVNTPIGYSAVDLARNGGTTDNMMADFIDDSIYKYLNTDGDATNDIDIFFNNAGGIRTDWCYVAGVWQTSGCTTSGLHDPGLLTYGNMFTVLPFGNATVVGQMTGAHILEVLNQGPLVSNGVIQVAGLKYKYYKYTDTLPPGNTSSPYPYAWGAYDVQVFDKATSTWRPLSLTKTYNVGTNEFLAPAGGDGYSGFKYMTNITYWGDMLNAVDAYVSATYDTEETAYKGPNGNGMLDGRIGLNGNGDAVYDPGEIVPLTILHHNDSHGNLYKNGNYAGLTQLATLIKQEQAHNPNRTLLFTAGDNIQGDGISFYYKSSYTGFAVDGTDLHSPPQPVDLTTDPIIAAMNLLGYDAMTLGNHEFNFGSAVFKGVLGQANFPILDADVTDGAGGNTYGLDAATHGEGVKPYIEKTLGAEGIKIGIMGLGNPRIPNYELPSNILGLTFANNLGVNDPITRAQSISNTLRSNGDDVVLALTHLGFTDPTDPWVDTYLASHTTGIDAILGGHSHTDPTNNVAYPYIAPYKYLPGIWASADGKPVEINQAYRYNYMLGEVVLGLRANGSGGYDVVSETGRNLAVCTNGKTGTGLTCSPDTPEDPATKALIDPYKDVFTTYNNSSVGQTDGPIDARQAYTQETTGANLQADAAVFELADKLPNVHVDFHLSGAMSNTAVALTGPYPVNLTVANMFTLMPYENSLVVLSMNGPQLKAVLERGYRNYYYYKYDPGHGGYSYYTTCMLDTNAGNQIVYRDANPQLPDGNNVVALKINGTPVDFTDAATYYNVSTVNYLAAGSCNFSDGPGTSLWPLNQTVADTQFYVRDAVIDYLKSVGTVSPAVEGRLTFLTPKAYLPTISYTP
jgi:2',3'-cyclic-nucleotide 2'-phosphodiesterase/3'-nucleotidase/5'-nucleotidase